jgi:hypothetical protein
MKKELKLKLIEGIFDQSDTNEIILSMIEKKIQFHEINSFRNFVKHNKKDAKLQKRIDALKKDLKLFIIGSFIAFFIYSLMTSVLSR